MNTSAHHPVILCILDGFGVNHSKDYAHDAIKHANTPCLDFFYKNFPHTELETSGESVGLPKGQMGNSEVGHMTIGSGRVVLQDLLRINKSIADGDLKKHPLLKQLINDHQNTKSSVHLLGLCSDGGVHSHLQHLLYLSTILAEHNISVKLHLFLDGRDVGPKTATIFLKQIEGLISKHQNIKIATISGRFYAMDRDNRWERVELAYKAIALSQGQKISSSKEYIENQYNDGISDEFIIPASFADYNGINENDSLLFINFRSDRVRQLAQSLLVKSFDKFSTSPITLKHKIGMTHYSDELNKLLKTLFPEQKIDNTLADVISKNGKTQLRLAETEKYAHVTFFFNGGKEEKYAGEDRILVSSPKVQTYDLKPEMSAHEVTEKLVEAIESAKYDLIIVNYANCDMVGHSGKLAAAIKAVEAIDQALNEIYKAIEKTNGLLMITADHGNVEHMYDLESDSIHTAHTTNPVPLLLISNNLKQQNLKLTKGNLSDIAPSILKLMKLDIPKEMTGSPIL